METPPAPKPSKAKYYVIGFVFLVILGGILPKPPDATKSPSSPVAAPTLSNAKTPEEYAELALSVAKQQFPGATKSPNYSFDLSGKRVTEGFLIGNTTTKTISLTNKVYNVSVLGGDKYDLKLSCSDESIILLPWVHIDLQSIIKTKGASDAAFMKYNELKNELTADFDVKTLDNNFKKQLDSALGIEGTVCLNGFIWNFDPKEQESMRLNNQKTSAAPQIAKSTPDLQRAVTPTEDPPIHLQVIANAVKEQFGNAVIFKIKNKYAVGNKKDGTLTVDLNGVETDLVFVVEQKAAFLMLSNKKDKDSNEALLKLPFVQRLNIDLKVAAKSQGNQADGITLAWKLESRMDRVAEIMRIRCESYFGECQVAPVAGGVVILNNERAYLNCNICDWLIHTKQFVGPYADCIAATKDTPPDEKHLSFTLTIKENEILLTQLSNSNQSMKDFAYGISRTLEKEIGIIEWNDGQFSKEKDPLQKLFYTNRRWDISEERIAQDAQTKKAEVDAKQAKVAAEEAENLRIRQAQLQARQQEIESKKRRNISELTSAAEKLKGQIIADYDSAVKANKASFDENAKWVNDEFEHKLRGVIQYVQARPNETVNEINRANELLMQSYKHYYQEFITSRRAVSDQRFKAKGVELDAINQKLQELGAQTVTVKDEKGLQQSLSAVREEIDRIFSKPRLITRSDLGKERK